MRRSRCYLISPLRRVQWFVNIYNLWRTTCGYCGGICRPVARVKLAACLSTSETGSYLALMDNLVRDWLRATSTDRHSRPICSGEPPHLDGCQIGLRLWLSMAIAYRDKLVLILQARQCERLNGGHETSRLIFGRSARQFTVISLCCLTQLGLVFMDVRHMFETLSNNTHDRTNDHVFDTYPGWKSQMDAQ